MQPQPRDLGDLGERERDLLVAVVARAPFELGEDRRPRRVRAPQ